MIFIESILQTKYGDWLLQTLLYSIFATELLSISSSIQ